MERRDFLQQVDCFVCNQQEAGLLFSDDYDHLSPAAMREVLDVYKRQEGVLGQAQLVGQLLHGVGLHDVTLVLQIGVHALDVLNGCLLYTSCSSVTAALLENTSGTSSRKVSFRRNQCGQNLPTLPQKIGRAHV